MHRDLKPENLIFNDENKLTLIDFGTADVQLRKGHNEELFEKYSECRKKYCKNKYDPESMKEDLVEEGEKLLHQMSKSKKSFVGTVYYIAPEMLIL